MKRLRVAVDVRCLEVPQLAERGIGTYAREVLARLDGVERVVIARRNLAVPARLRTGKVKTDFILESPFFLRALARARADVAFYPSPYGLPFPPLAAGPPAVVAFFDAIPWRFPEAEMRGPLERAYFAGLARALRRARRVLAISAFSARDGIELLRLRPGRVRVVPLGVAARFRPAPPEAIACVREKYRLGLRTVVYMGGFDFRKNVPVLLRAFARARRADEAIDLALAGRLEPRERAPLEAEIAALGTATAARVRLLGFVPDEDAPALLSAASVFAFPSQCEGFGLPPLEAMACGVPCVAFRNSAIAEVCGEEAAWLVADGDEAAFAAALRALLDDPAERARRAAAGIARAAAFGWEKTASAVAAAIAEVARRA